MEHTLILFPGQGSQYVGMNETLFEQFPEARAVFEEAGDILHLDLISLCREGPANALMNTETAQPALLCYGVAAYRMLQQSLSLTPSFMAGHSVGEITALSCGGAITFEDALLIVRKRGQLMAKVSGEGKGGMTALLGLDMDAVQSLCKEIIQKNIGYAAIANFNASDQIVVSGDFPGLDGLELRCKQIGGKAVRLKVSAPFHSILLQDCVPEFRDFLSGFDFFDPCCSILSNTDCSVYTESSEIPSRLAEHIVSPVRWKETMDYFARMPVSQVIECGPKAVLSKLTAARLPFVPIYSVDKTESMERLMAEEISRRTALMKHCVAEVVCCPNYSRDAKQYQSAVIQPYQAMQGRIHTMVRQNRLPAREDVLSAYQLLCSVLTTKEVPQSEVNVILEGLRELDGTGLLSKENNIPRPENGCAAHREEYYEKNTNA